MADDISHLQNAVRAGWPKLLSQTFGYDRFRNRQLAAKSSGFLVPAAGLEPA
jgi:hypothetical protein